MANTLNLQQLAEQLEQQTEAPAINQWQPADCGPLAMRIDHRGQWFYQGEPIRREALVKIFSDILRKEGQHYYLVTPVEKFQIQVDDLPFITQELEVKQDPITQQQLLVLTLNHGLSVTLSQAQPLIFAPNAEGDLLPAVYVQRQLLARLHRNHYYQLAELAEPADSNAAQDSEQWGVWSSGQFFPLMPADPSANFNL